MARPTSRFVCQACGGSYLRWEGQCRACGAWDTLVETLVREPARSPRRRAPAGTGAPPVALRDVSEPPLTRRSVGSAEIDRVLGGGLVPGSLVLLGGEPGIGKSTLVLAAAAGIAQAGEASSDAGSDAGAGTDAHTVLYVSGEESAGQVRLRARRLGLTEGTPGARVHVLAETDVERIVEIATAARPAALVVDSIQTVRIDGLEGPAGSVGQVRESAQRLQGFAKASGVPVVLVGHVTKEGSLAGPKTLEHLVDAVLTLEGERSSGLRLLRATKNRFGSIEEIGVFAMGERGLRPVADPARAFLAEHSEPAPGSVVGIALEGTRPLLVEVQALVAPAAGFGPPRRTVSGLDGNRLALLLAVLARRAGIGLGSQDVYASLAGGLSAAEPGLDLPLALALTSSVQDRAVDPTAVAVGEVGLLGELRAVSGLERRLREAERLGFRRAVVPRGGRAGERLPGHVGALRVDAVETLREALRVALTAPEPAAPVANGRP